MLPPVAGTIIKERYDRIFKGLQLWCDYRVINLWEIDANIVLEHPPLLPFTPMLKGGGNERMIREAAYLLRQHEKLKEMELLLGFLARFFLETEVIKRILRWDMVVLDQSPWYQEIMERGRLKGIEEGWNKGIGEERFKGMEEGRWHEQRFLTRRIIEKRKR